MADTSVTEMTSQADISWRPDLRAPIVMGLTGLLILQLLVALGLGLGSGRGMAPGGADTPLFSFTADQVQAIHIEGGAESTGVVIRRRGDSWILPDLADLPVEGSKVDQLLVGLAELKRSLPIATSEAARKRFKVADAEFERRLVLDGEHGPIASLLIGDSPGFRRVFGRPPDDPAVYDLKLALSDVSARRDDWIDMGLLHLEREQITRVGTDDWTLTKAGDGGWTLANTDQAVDQQAVDSLLASLSNLGYRGVLGTDDDPAYNQQTPRLVLSIGLGDGSTRTYRISQAEDSEDYVLKDTGRPWYFKLSEFDLGDLLSTDAASLAGKTDSQETPAQPDHPGAPTEESESPGDAGGEQAPASSAE
ncbi:MAG: DUF4340 domain-containing protein [Thiocapsa sp.]|jgi:hypothetical protein|nr:DUF4340 domain-containing protein [Thiocapsa sp.]MCG6983599.1 DUF4340 domain-containing protein [Thiocapsa sp.]